MIDNASGRKEPMQPEAVIAGFVARHDLRRPSARLTFSTVCATISISLSTAAHGMLRSDIFGDKGVKTPTSQFDLLSSIAMKQVASAAFSNNNRDDGRCMFSLQLKSHRLTRCPRPKWRAWQGLQGLPRHSSDPPISGQFVLHAKALHGNPYDGYTLGPVIADLQTLTGVEVRRVHVDKG